LDGLLALSLQAVGVPHLSCILFYTEWVVSLDLLISVLVFFWLLIFCLLVQVSTPFSMSKGFNFSLVSCRSPLWTKRPQFLRATYLRQFTTSGSKRLETT
jgi:hypothetical protein